MVPIWCPQPTVPDTFGCVSHVTPAPSAATSPAGRRTDARPPGRPDVPATEAPDGRSTRWADHREARRAELVHVARRTVHHHGPDVSMDEIAAAAGTSKSIVYRYFTDKTGLQIAVAEAVVRQIQAALEDALRGAPTPREGTRAMVGVYLEMIEASPHVYAFVTRDGSVETGGPLGHFLEAVTALVATPFARSLTEDRDDPDPAATALADAWAAGAVGFVRGAGEWWLAHRDAPGAPDRDTLTTHVTAWLWAGPVGLLAREHPRTPAPAHPADPHPPGGDEAAPTPREQR